MQRSNAGLFWPVLVLVTAIDFCTKAVAAARLEYEALAHPVQIGLKQVPFADHG